MNSSIDEISIGFNKRTRKQNKDWQPTQMNKRMKGQERNWIMIDLTFCFVRDFRNLRSCLVQFDLTHAVVCLNGKVLVQLPLKKFPCVLRVSSSLFRRIDSWVHVSRLQLRRVQPCRCSRPCHAWILANLCCIVATPRASLHLNTWIAIDMLVRCN